MSVTIRGLEELQHELKKMEPAPLRKTLQKGTAAGGKLLKPHAKAAAPKRTGKLRRSIVAQAAKRDKPASIVKVRTGKSGAWYRHFVQQGTKAHRIRFPDQKAANVPKSQGNIRHPGAKADPFMERTQVRYEDAAAREAIETIQKELP